MANPIIALDFDDVLVDLSFSYFNFLNHKYGKNFVRSNFPRGTSIFDVFDISCEYGIKIFSEFENSKFAGDLIPIEGAKQGVEELFKKYDLTIITSREEKAREFVQDFSRDYFNSRISEVYLGIKDKVSFCEGLGAMAIVDDQYSNIEKKSDLVKRILLTRDWNFKKDLDGSGVIRADNWQGVLDEF